MVPIQSILIAAISHAAQPAAAARARCGLYLLEHCIAERIGSASQSTLRKGHAGAATTCFAINYILRVL